MITAKINPGEILDLRLSRMVHPHKKKAGGQDFHLATSNRVHPKRSGRSSLMFRDTVHSKLLD